MPKVMPLSLSVVLTALPVILILKVTLSVVVGYRDYFPPHFEADFLLGREGYFWGPYCVAFYAHLVGGPLTLLLGTILVSDRFRARAPRWHRRLGRWQVACILLLLVPSGLWMARYAQTGLLAAAGLALLALTTAACTALGWRAAVARRFDDHRRWMSRTYMLLLSAVVIRMIGGLAMVLQLDTLWLYPLSAWISWLLPLLAFESWRLLVPQLTRLATS